MHLESMHLSIYLIYHLHIYLSNHLSSVSYVSIKLYIHRFYLGYCWDSQ